MENTTTDINFVYNHTTPSYARAGLMLIDGTDHTLKNVTAYDSSIIIHNAAGNVTIDSIEVAEYSLGIFVYYDNVKGNNSLTIEDSRILNQCKSKFNATSWWSISDS